MKINGTFEVNLHALDTFHTGHSSVELKRMSINKTYQGALQATSQGEMLSVITPVEDSAAYVAVEEVQGTLEGKQGSFVLQHFGSMNRDDIRLILEVVPDSATGDLVGLRGKMNIDIQDGEHLYVFDYELV
ncbi:MAG: hypothetical protein CR991_02895 [Proteobacteria bacterium]|nr:MAG: hypothetical protein CR991_02895 [Pseudomonadota bacterium]